MYLDDFLYPRDDSLNLIDVGIDCKIDVNARKGMVVYADFLSAYRRAKYVYGKVKKLESKDVEALTNARTLKSKSFRMDDLM